MALKRTDIGKLGLRAKGTPPKKFRAEGATERGDYADPARFKYPIHKEENVRNAIARFGDSANREGYPADEQRKIAGRILRAARKFNILVDPSSMVGRLAGLKRK